MQTFVTKTATETKKLQSRRNLFGLGLTSLIAACSGAAADGAGGSGETEEERIAREAREQEARADALPFKAKELTGDKAGNYAAGIDSASDLTVTVNKPAPAETATLTFSNGAATDANAGIYRLTPNLRQYDLVISAPNIDKIPPNTNPEAVKGRIFIYWDVAKVANKDSTHLEIKGAKRGDNIGINAPEFLKIGGTDNKYDMVIRSHQVDKEGSGSSKADGAIYILWDIVDYDEATKTIDLNPTELGNANTGATSGSLAIYGATSTSKIGTYSPDFLQIGGKDNNYDMVIRPVSSKGIIYILWDVSEYADSTSSIDLGNISEGATFGFLRIYGAKHNDNIGIHAPEFLQIGGDGDNYDMVIRSHVVDNEGDGAQSGNPSNNTDEGAIYILWDVEDYYGEINPNNKTIDLGAVNNSGGFHATSGLLTIYGAAAQANLGENDDKNILYKTVAGNKTLTNIDKDTDGTEGDAGTIDIAITDGVYTYVFFGDKIAAKNGDGTKVASKTIDLAKIVALDFLVNGGDNEGYFEYTFGDLTDTSMHTAEILANKTGATGYRFANNAHKTLEDVEGSSPFSSSLSDADADLGGVGYRLNLYALKEVLHLL